MANDYQDDDQKVAGYFDDITAPLTKAGIDPDEAMMNRDAALAKVSGTPDYPGGANYPARPESDGGASTVAPAAPTQAAPQAAAEKTWADYTRQGLEGQLRSTQGSEDTVKKLSQMPSDDPALSKLEAQRAEAATPINPQDQKYRPTFGQKVMRGVKAVATGGLPGLAVADYKGPNRQYGIDREQQTEQVGSIDQQITQARKNYEDASSRLKGIAQEQGKVATGYKDVVSGAVGQEGAENKQELQQAQAERDRAKAELDRTKAGETQEPKTETEIALALSKAQQSGDTESVKKYQGALSIMKVLKQSGRDTSASDVAKAIQASEFGERQTLAINKEKDAERNKLYAPLENDIDLMGNSQKKEQARAEIDAQLEAKYAPRIQAVHDKVADMLNLTRQGQKLNASDTQRNAAKPKGNNSPKPRPAPGTRVMVDGKPATITGWNEKTGKPVVQLTSQSQTQ